MFTIMAAAALKFTLAWVTFSGDMRGLLRVKATTPLTAERIRLEASGEDFGRVTEQDVRSDTSVMIIEWRDVPEGEYVVEGVARLTDGRLIRATPLQVRVR